MSQHRELGLELPDPTFDCDQLGRPFGTQTFKPTRVDLVSLWSSW